MSQTIKSKGFTLIELLVVVGIIGALIGILVPVLAIARKRSNMMIEGTNLSSATKALAVYADGNKLFYPGLSNTGKFGSDFFGQKYSANTNGSSATGGYGINACNSYAYAVMMDEDAMAPKQLLSTGETNGNSTATAITIVEATMEATTAKATLAATSGLVNSHLNSSYALLAYADSNLRAEWKATTSQQAPVIATRLIFSEALSVAIGTGTYNCVWTDINSGKWEGSVVRNDTSVGREKFGSNADILDQFKGLKYGSKICPTGSISSATACALWGKAEATAFVTPLAANFGTVTSSAGTDAKGFLGAAND